MTSPLPGVDASGWRFTPPHRERQEQANRRQPPCARAVDRGTHMEGAVALDEGMAVARGSFGN
jgi:hypothetical protein